MGSKEGGMIRDVLKALDSKVAREHENKSAENVSLEYSNSDTIGGTEVNSDSRRELNELYDENGRTFIVDYPSDDDLEIADDNDAQIIVFEGMQIWRLLDESIETDIV